jgi:hypothetical protein
VLCVVWCVVCVTHEEHFYLCFSFRRRDALAHPSSLCSVVTDLRNSQVSSLLPPPAPWTSPPLHTSQSLVEEGTGTELFISYSSSLLLAPPLLSHHPSNPELRT